jgi:hypothetical protein
MNDFSAGFTSLAQWRDDIAAEAARLPAWLIPPLFLPPWYLAIEPERKRYSRREFITSRNSDFIEQVYRALLKRGPSTLEIDSTFDRLDGGYGEVEIIGDLLGSAEGRAIGVKVRGVRSRYRLARLFRWPVIGGWLERLYMIFQVRTVARDQTLIEERLSHRGDESEQYAAQVISHLQSEIDRLQKQVSLLSRRIDRNGTERDGGDR